MSAASALFFLRTRSLQNVLQSRLRRLRQPKYLFGAIVGIAYLYLVFLRGRNRSSGVARSMSEAVLPAVNEVAVLLIAAALLLGMTLCWVWPRARAALSFTEAEVAFLFAAPIARRTLVHYRLLNVILRVMLTALILALVSANWRFVPGDFPIRFIGWWLILAVASLHVVGSSFVITHWLDRGLTSTRRAVLGLAVLSLVGFGLTIWFPRSGLPMDASDLSGFQAFATYLSEVAQTGPLYWLLLPTRLVVAPMLSSDAGSFLMALGPALLVLALHYVWVLRVEVGFEEASIAKAEKRTARLAALREGKLSASGAMKKAQKPPFNLSSARRPELAFLWKNLLATTSYLRLRGALIAAVLIVIGGGWLNAHPEYLVFRRIFSVFTLIGIIILLTLGPQMARQDFRSDLKNTDILKSYPLHGWQVVLGEILTPVVLLTGLIWLFALGGAVLFDSERMGSLPPQFRIYAALAIAGVAPFLCAIQVLVVNAAAVLFPAWLLTHQDRANQGIDVLGQRILFMAAQFLVFVVALLPAALAAAVVFFAVQWMQPLIAGALAVLAVMAVLATEAALAIRWLGTRFEKFDLSAELRP